MKGNVCMIDYPEMREELTERLQEIGFNMKDWHINTFNAEGEGHIYEIQDKSYQSCDYIYLINKINRKDVFYLWLDIAWVEGMKYPVLYILYLHAEDVESEIDSLTDSIEKHFTRNYNPKEKTEADTDSLIKKYSLLPLPTPMDVVKAHVTSEQFDAIQQEWLQEKRPR